MGAPTKYKDEFCARVVELMKDGASKIEVCADLEISFETLSDWTNTESPRFKDNFSESIKRGELLSQSWWEKEGRISLRDRDFNYTGWFMNVKNRFGKSPVPWSDRQELKHSGSIKHENDTGEEIDNKIKSILSKLNADSD